MDDPRALILERLRHGKVRVDMNSSWLKKAREEFLDAIVYVIADYIDKGRKNEPEKMSVLEIKYFFDRDFMHCKNPRKWLEEHRELDDNGLIMFIYDNVDEMPYCFHSKTVRLLTSMIYSC